MPYSMLVLKRDGRKETVSFDKVLGRVRKASKGLAVNPDALAQQVLAQIFDGVKTSELDELTAQLAASLTTLHPDYGTLAGRISISNHHKNTTASFSEVMLRLSDQKMPQTGEVTSFIHPALLASIKEHGSEIDAKIHHDRDYLLDYFGFKTLERSYLLKDTSMVVQERPQHMWMRVALALWFNDLPRAFETYDYLSTKCFTHATPTLFNAGTPRQQLSSCFLLAMSDDSIQGIYKTLGDCAAISKFAGGIGLHLHNVRARGSLIKGTNGQSNGLVPMLRVFNNTARYVDQCFTPDTMIYTEAGVKAIEDVSITDKVLTSKGLYVRVNQPLRHTYSGPMLEIRAKHSVTPIRVTPEHQVFALKGQKKMLNYDVIRNRIDKNLATVTFTDAKDLEVDDFVVFPIPTYECDIPSISEDDCRFYGILLGDGHISKDVAGVCLNRKTKQETREFVEAYLSNRGITVNTYEDEETNTVRLKWSTSSPGFKFTASQLYDENHLKRMESCWLHLPLVKAKQIVKGLIETDGCIGTKEITLEVTSYHLIESLRYILLRLGALSSGYERNRVGSVSSYKNITTNLPTAVLRIPRIPEIMEMFPFAPAASWFNFMKHNGYLYTRIEEISESEYSGTVHDFEVEDPHDYTVAHLGITHNGGGKRNGSFAMYLEPWHADVEDFLKMRLNTGSEEERARDLFYALWIPDLFMERVEADGDWSLFCPNEAPGLSDVWGDEFKTLYERYEKEGRARKVVKAQKLWFQTLDSQMETGTPYLLYKDAANRKSNQQNLGTIKSSNLCVAPETLVLTDKGEFPICEIVGQTVRVWNGETFSDVEVKQTGSNQELLDVELSDGRVLTCTPYHKFLISEGYSDKSSIANSVRVDASDLKKGMKLKKGSLPTIVSGENDFNYAYTHGFFCGDGTYSNGRPSLSLYGDKKDLVPYLDIRSMTGIIDKSGRLNTQLPLDLEKKFEVPLNTSIQCRLEWLSGLLDADGCICRNGDNESIQIASIEYSFLKKVQSMLLTMGVQSKVNQSFGERKTMLPDGKGGYAEFDCKPLWRLLISSSGLYHLSTLGFVTRRLKWTARKPQRNAEAFVSVVQVIRRGRYDDTYCFNEPINHAGVFNGILTGNCTEIIEYSSKDETAVCNLASLALPSFVVDGVFDYAKLREVTRVAIRNLNRVIDINFYPTPETERSNIRHRPVGLGVQGLADVFALLGLAWEQEEAAKVNQLIFEHMYFAAVEASVEIAKVEGPYSTFKGSPASKGLLQPDLWSVTPITETDGSLDWAKLRESVKTHGLRNSLLIAPMPTASTSQILGFNECFEPFTSNLYTRRTLAGEFIVINRYLLADLMKAGLWSEDMKQQIVARNGSVQGIPGISEELQLRYKTSWEMKQKVLIDMAAARGAFICQSQSLNLFVADPTYSKLTSMHFYAWKQGLKTGCYYLRTKAPVTAQKFTVDPRLMAAVQNNQSQVEGQNQRDDNEGTYDSESDSDDDSVSAPDTTSIMTSAEKKKALLDKLAAEYEAEVASMALSKSRGEEVCEMCSS